jgi:hypothetical protein
MGRRIPHPLSQSGSGPNVAVANDVPTSNGYEEGRPEEVGGSPSRIYLNFLDAEEVGGSNPPAPTRKLGRLPAENVAEARVVVGVVTCFERFS